MLKSQGFTVETLVVDNLPSNSEGRARKLIEKVKTLKGKSISEVSRVVYAKVSDTIYKSEYKNSRMIRTEKFKEFTELYINETEYSISDNNIPEDIADRYDYFVVGSDQVWNPYYTKGSPIYFLGFAPRDRRFSYSASFGISQIPHEYRELYQRGLLDMEYLSVRENDGSRIIRELTGIDVPVHVDPTLLLTKEQWLAISKQASNKPKGPYVLTYFLGGIPENHRNQIKNMAKANSLEVINLGDIREKETYRTGPGEFIDYINDCALFCTDSFHGAVFSILLRKPFIVYERTDYAMFSRLSTLLEKFNLQSRKIEKIDNIEDAFKIDFSHILTILEAERNKSVDYLRNCLA